MDKPIIKITYVRDSEKKSLKKILKKYDGDCFIIEKCKGAYKNYNNEKVVIINNFDSQDYPIIDFLNILDCHGTGSKWSNNKKIKIYIISYYPLFSQYEQVRINCKYLYNCLLARITTNVGIIRELV